MVAIETREPHVPEEITVLHRVSRIVSSELSLDEMLGEIVGLTSQISGCDACLVYLVELPTEEFVLRASQVPHAADLGTLRMKIGEGVTGWVAEHQSPVALSSNAAADSRFKNFPGLGGRHLSGLPVRAGDQQRPGDRCHQRAPSRDATNTPPRKSPPSSSSANKWVARSPRVCWRKKTRA